MEQELSLEFLRVVEQAAIASARTMGLGDGHKSDQAAVEAMRKEMDTVSMDGTIVIGEGERDKAPMLYIGEKVGLAARDKNHQYPAVDIAVDPLEGTNLCATGEPNAITVLAASDHGRTAARARSIHGKDHRRPAVQRRRGAGRTAGAKPAGHRQAARSQSEGPGGNRAGPAAARETDSGHSQGRRAHPADPGRRPLGGNQRRGFGHGRPCGDGNRRRAGRSADRGGAAMPERPDSRVA